jgi:outer membrane receptor protein involved in Fe transport
VRVDGLVGTASQRTDQDRLATATRPRSLESSESSYRDLQLRVVAERAAGRARLLGGVDLQGRYGLRTRDTTTNYDVAGAETSATTSLSIDEANRTGLGVFVEASAPVTRRLFGTIGGRVDGVSNRNRGGFWGDRSIRSAAFAGVAALTAVPADAVSVTAQVARGFRDPTLSDRFYRGPVGRGIVEGNPDLAPETSLQIDLTTRIALGRLHTEVSAYRYRIVDLVERYPVNQALFRFRNRGDARFQGVEVAASVRLERGFGLEAAAQVSRGRDGADGTPLDDVAPIAGSVVVRHAVSGRATSYLRVAVYGSHNAAGPSEVPTPAHELLDAGTSIRLTPALVVHATVRNLLGDAYYASAGPRWVFAPGRQVTLTASISF